MILDITKPSTAQVDALLEEWKKDAVIDKLEPSEELRKVSGLHSKYLTILSAHRRAFKEGERRYAKLRRLKYEFFTGKLDQDTLKKYNWQPFPYTLKGDMATYMDSDPDILNAKQVLGIHGEIVEVSESILKDLSNRVWVLKDIVKWEMFIAGSH